MDIQDLAIEVHAIDATTCANSTRAVGVVRLESELTRTRLKKKKMKKTKQMKMKMKMNSTTISASWRASKEKVGGVRGQEITARADEEEIESTASPELRSARVNEKTVGTMEVCQLDRPTQRVLVLTFIFCFSFLFLQPRPM